MRLDHSKPFGQVWGHSYASYEQGGHMFDGSGNLITAEDVQELAPTDDENLDEVSKVSKFIKDSLSGGPVSQAALYKDAQTLELNWTEVKTEAAAIGVAIEIVKGKPIWSLK